MKVEGLFFALLAAFLFTTRGVYWLLSRAPTGFTCLCASGPSPSRPGASALCPPGGSR